MTERDLPLTVIGARGPTLVEQLREVMAYGELILSFARRDIRARYKQTALGIAWAVLQPFSLMVIFTLVFSKLARVPSDGIPYPIFAYSGLIFWTFFASSVSQGTIAMVANASLVRKIYFPRETLLLGALVAGALDLAISFLIFGGMLFYYRVPPTWAVVWVVPLLVLQVLVTLGVICITSAVHVYFRDIGHGIPLVVQLWMFATPVAYPLSLVPDWLTPLYLLNPMAPVIDGYRRALLHGASPNIVHLGTGLVVSMLLVGVAYVGFKRAERTFADVI